MTSRTIPDETEALGEARTVSVWDPLVRIFHWTLVASFATAWLFEDPGWLHEGAGYVALGLIGFRLVWGLIGSRHARFSGFLRGPRAVLRYLLEIVSGHPARHLGHNPAGGAMIVALLLMVAITSGSGWLMTTDSFWGADWLEEVHEFAAHLTVVLVALHVLGVLIASLQHRENLVSAMITGRKRC